MATKTISTELLIDDANHQARLYIITANDLTDFHALISAIGTASKKGLGGRLSDKDGNACWLTNTEGLRRFFAVRRLARRGVLADDMLFWSIDVQGHPFAFTREQFDAAIQQFESYL